MFSLVPQVHEAAVLIESQVREVLLKPVKAVTEQSYRI